MTQRSTARHRMARTKQSKTELESETPDTRTPLSTHLPPQCTDSETARNDCPLRSMTQRSTARLTQRSTAQNRMAQHKTAKWNCRQSDTGTLDTRTPLSTHSAPVTTVYLTANIARNDCPQRSMTQRSTHAQQHKTEWHAQNGLKNNLVYKTDRRAGSTTPPTPALHFRRTAHLPRQCT
jgi:hypothetical protein